MTFDFKDLHDATRRHMLSEIASDIARGTLSPSTRFRPGAMPTYQALLQESAESHNDAWLAEQIRKLRLFVPNRLA